MMGLQSDLLNPRRASRDSCQSVMTGRMRALPRRGSGGEDAVPTGARLLLLRKGRKSGSSFCQAPACSSGGEQCRAHVRIHRLSWHPLALASS